MMSSINTINRVLIKLGEPPIASLQDTPYGARLNIIYADMTESLLSWYQWNFAVRRVYLARIADYEQAGTQFMYAYQLPFDCLLPLQIGEEFKTPNLNNYISRSDARFAIEGDCVLSNEKNGLFLRYVQLVNDEKFFSKSFREALICKIAIEFAPTLNKSSVSIDRLEREFSGWIDKARENNEFATDTETMPDGSWVYVRDYEEM